MNKQQFEALGLKWKHLNQVYDQEIQKFFDNPEIKPDPVLLEKLKIMQQELWDLESAWYRIAENQESL